MKDNLTDLNKFREKKLKEREDEYNIELLKNVLCKRQDELTDGEKFTYNQIKLVISFRVKDIYTMGIIEFRSELYVINATPYETFEYLGKLDDMILKYLNLE